MSPLMQEILKLSVSERIQLIEAIWNNIPAQDSYQELSDEHKELLDERLVAHEADPLAGSSWESVKKRIEDKFSH